MFRCIERDLERDLEQGAFTELAEGAPLDTAHSKLRSTLVLMASVRAAVWAAAEEKLAVFDSSFNLIDIRPEVAGSSAEVNLLLPPIISTITPYL
mmetsp:Transcript_29741/g.49281  ORF Transcript_29741/g.49281 Transcript_29741/m.49281 type:complete len:95 (-) Transcript_29741:2058-2342(-)